MYLLGGIIGLFLTFIMIPLIIQMLKNAGMVRPNYAGEEIPVGLGLAYLLSTATALSFISATAPMANYIFLLLIAMFAMGLLGIIDDAFGSRVYSGLKGHFIALIKDKTLTTGAIKAIFGGLISLYLGSFYGWGIFIILNGLIIALMTNTLNLLDLRPGRAIKGFIFIYIIILLLTGWNEEVKTLSVLLINLLIYFPFDLKAKAMMGDTGSNVLGVSLGLTMVSTFSIAAKLGTLILLIILHIYTEKYSLSKTIEKFSVLRAIDKLGR